jgi:hypothetical protein
MHDDDYTPEERRLFEALPRESAPDPRDEERIAARLRAEGFFSGTLVASTFKWKAALAAAAILALGIFIGSTFARPEITGSACAELPGAVPSSADPSHKEPVRTAGVLWF